MKDPEVLPQHQRENAEPHELPHPVPWLLILATAALLGFGVGYIVSADIDSPSSWGDGRRADELSGRGADSGPSLPDGSALYGSLCSGCHQASGQGLPGVFPPLAGSEWVLGQEKTTAAIVLYGLTGPIQVKGNRYDGAMPAFKDQLDDKQLAALLTHVRSQWGNSAGAVAPQVVAEVREQHKARNAPFVGGKDLPAP